jgi:nitrile hydratase beta subunit-like protein
VIERSHHDMGGLPAGKVERTEHEYEMWERRVDAMRAVLGARGLVTVDEMRKNIEAIPPQAYDRMAYYEKWVTALAQTLLQRGVITTAEMSRKMEEICKRNS